MHDQRIVHGNLKVVRRLVPWSPSCTQFTRSEANVLIDNDGRARLTGFNLVTIASRQPTMSPPPPAASAIPWMSPELLYPEKFGLENSYSTKGSDCYALGMVIYEVLSGLEPFATYRDSEVVLMVLHGERPKRPQGDEGDRSQTGFGMYWDYVGRNSRATA
jgi:serine/threonine protein kinase